MKLIVILKKNLQKASLVLHAFVSTKGMYINLIPVRDKVGRGGGFFIKEQWEKSLLSVGPENSHGYLLRCCK